MVCDLHIRQALRRYTWLDMNFDSGLLYTRWTQPVKAYLSCAVCGLRNLSRAILNRVLALANAAGQIWTQFESWENFENHE